MLSIVVKHEKKRIVILSEVENGAALLIYLAGGCKCGYPLIGTSDYWGKITPHWIAWAFYLVGALIIAFDVSKTVCITPAGISMSYFWGMIFRRYKWEEILFWGTWQKNAQKQKYIYLSTKRPKHVLLFESLNQCHLQYSEELFALICLLKNGAVPADFEFKRMTDENLSVNRRRYYAIRLLSTGIFVLFSLLVMISDAFEVWCIIIVIGLVVFTFYRIVAASALMKLEATYYDDFITYCGEILTKRNTETLN